MKIKNTQDQYGLVAKIFHWAIAFLIIGLIPVGLFMGGMENSPLKFEVYAMHKSFGLLVLFLGIGRIVWRFVSPPPHHLQSHQPWERALAKASHAWLYVCVIGMPLTGWLMSSASEFPVPFFGMQMPHIIGKDEALGELFYQAHEILAYTLLFVLALHMAGALKHHVIDRDETLQRMTWKNAGLGLAAAIVLIAGASYAASGLTFLNGDKEQHSAKEIIQNPTLGDVLATKVMDEHGWSIVPDKSRLGFKATLYGSQFEGVFGTFGGTIVFNPDDLSTAVADITIDMKNVKTGDSDRDSNIVGSDWFDSEKHPEARFMTTGFEKTGENSYLAMGNLVIRGVTMPLNLPFNLTINGGEAVMKAEATLNRLDFGIGTGQWEDEKTVGHSVNVVVDLTAVQ